MAKNVAMSNPARRAVTIALIELATSRDVSDRADAGRSLAGFVADPDARAALVDLLLDAADTFVTRVTAEALLRRQDTAGLAVVATALAGADSNHADWIQTAVLDVFGVFGDERDAVLLLCEALPLDPDDRVRAGAPQLIAMLTDIDPMLLPSRE
ncbi:hypothetical protein Q0Z83_052110 [Actinoplanes sichuanensis]|uniref:HEAT repeat domain-containing protein n=1 Tax=Actinoplanes sichuanensis TaxID=512349 RepID=A0ABW4ARW2_9ACTN|nr:hypothetical protein [Actinoplanes sichuanensis]BEL07020.1 hypothetical protein Q0Z83_052110 [Actinoplanes sichuanensis]